MTERVCLISLGCAKNLVNSEQMLYQIAEAGYELCAEPELAAAVVINTCGFIDAAKSEAIETILENAALKNEEGYPKIVVTGCLSERYKDGIFEELPEVDALVGVGSFGKITDALEDVFAGRRVSRYGDISAPLDETPRIVSTGPSWAYLKIADGCDNRCSYCAIPDIRGSFRSRTMENILREARELAADGVKELIIIAQDITRYGLDLYGERRLGELLRELCGISELEWIRLHYLYPDEIDDDLIDVIASEEKIVKYLDIPIQHISDELLRRMNRRGTGGEIRDLFGKLRERIPGVVLRTSLIVGFPGEGDEEFEELCEFLREFEIERAGVFSFSPEEGTAAAEMPEQVPGETAERRAELVGEIQYDIIQEFCASRIGRTLRALCEGEDAETGMHWGRSPADSPDIDGRVLWTGSGSPGEFAEVEITDTKNGDLIGVAI